MLLHSRSIVLQVCLILVATNCAKSQEYDYSAEDGDYNTEDGYSHPDYTKYFAGKTVNPESADNKVYNGGLPNEAEFASFFYTPLEFSEPNSKASTAPQTFAPEPSKKPDPFEALRQSFAQKEEASETNPLHKDYFEESQKKQQGEESAESGVHPGPHYVSHQIPVPTFFNTDDEDKAQSKDDVETIPPPLKGKHNTKKVKVNPARPGYDGFKDSYDAFEILRKTEEQIDQTKEEPSIYSGKNVDYKTGKSSSISQAYPAATGYLASLKIPTTTVTPYQKYSYQPDTSNYEALQSKYLGIYDTTASPLKHTEKAALSSKDDGEVAPTNNVPENLKNKGCRRISSPENSEGMNCFVCEDAANKAKYTQCSYTSADEPINEYAGSSLRYSSPVKPPTSYRYKRSPTRESYGDDPYFRVSENSKKYFDDFEKEQKEAESKREKEFLYSPYQPEEQESYSESQSSELLKEPGACEKIDREGMTCTVCKNPKTGGNFEQCSYTSAPKEQKYAYVAEKKYDSEDDAPEETKTIIKQSSEDPQKGESSSIVKSTTAPVSEFTTATKSKIVRDVIPELTASASTVDETSEESPETEEESDDEDTEDDKESEESEDKKEEKESSDDGPTYLFNYDELKKEKKLVDDDPYYVPEHFAESVDTKKTAEEGGDDGFDEYHYKLFPVFQNEAESKNEEQKREPEGNQQDVEEVLAEFAKKDRSNCKKAEKNGMTCFLCVDKNKVQHEECMYIAESKPKATHVAFHEVQRLKDSKDEEPTEESDGEESKVESLTQQPLDTVLPLASETSKRKKFFKKVITTPLPLENFELTAAASDVYRTVVPFEQPKKRATCLVKPDFHYGETISFPDTGFGPFGSLSKEYKDSLYSFDNDPKGSKQMSGKLILIVKHNKYSRKARKDSKASGSAPDSERLEDEESKKKSSEEPETPKEIDVGDEEGAYSYETKPVYSKRFGTTLPKYMVEKTEFEKEFDDAAGFD